jgi:hypothetical protein
MKKFTFFFFVTLLVPILGGSQTHNRIIQPELYTKAGGFTEIDHIYIHVSQCGNLGENCFTKYLYKIDKDNLSTIDSVDVNQLLGLNSGSTFDRLANLNDTCLLAIYQVDKGSFPNGGYFEKESIIAFFDLNLNLLQQFNLGSSIDTSKFAIQSIVPHDSSLFICGYLSPVFSNRYNGFVAEINNLGQIIREFHLPWDSLPSNGKAIINDLLIKDDSFIGTFLSGPQTQTFTLDRNLNLLSINNLTNYPTNNCFFYSGFQIFIPENERRPYLFNISGFIRNVIITNPNESPFDHKLGLVTLDSQYLYQRIDTFPFIGYHLNYAPFDLLSSANNTAHALKNDSLFFMASDNVFLWEFVWLARHPNRTFIYNVNGNQNMQVNWQRVYQPGYSHHAAGLRVLSGNRYLLIFTEYMWDTVPSENLRVRLMLLDETGAFLGDDNFASPSNPPQFYPNPASSTIRFNNTVAGEGSYQFEILDFNGRTVKKGHVDVQDALDVSDLPAATYQLILIDKTGWGWSTKLMISR